MEIKTKIDTAKFKVEELKELPARVRGNSSPFYNETVDRAAASETAIQVSKIPKDKISSIIAGLKNAVKRKNVQVEVHVYNGNIVLYKPKAPVVPTV